MDYSYFYTVLEDFFCIFPFQLIKMGFIRAARFQRGKITNICIFSSFRHLISTNVEASGSSFVQRVWVCLCWSGGSLLTHSVSEHFSRSSLLYRPLARLHHSKERESHLKWFLFSLPLCCGKVSVFRPDV